MVAIIVIIISSLYIKYKQIGYCPQFSHGIISFNSLANIEIKVSKVRINIDCYFDNFEQVRT